MPEIVQAEIASIAINPYRRLHDYPYVQSKLDALQNSIAEVGLWPSVIARPLKDRLWKYELAFGHHRIEAARRSALKTIPLIVEALTDKQMLQYMGRENLEDYNAVFLIQLESWEATIKSGLVRPRRRGQMPEAIDIAQLLGWLEPRKERPGSQLNHTARACRAAYALIASGEMSRENFNDVNVEAAEQIAERALTRITQLEERTKSSAWSPKQIAEAKQHIGQGAADTAQQVRAGKLRRKDIRKTVDFNAGVRANQAGKQSPLFAVFANAVADSLRRTIQLDGDAEKLAQIEEALPQLTMLEDWESLRRVDVELLNLGRRAEDWRKRLTPSQEKVVQFKALEGGRIDK